MAVSIPSCALSRAPRHDGIVRRALPTDTSIPSAWTAGSAASGVVGVDWVKTFQDPRLEELVAEAIANNLDLRQAAATVEIARQSAVVVGAQLLPSVNADIGASEMVHETNPSHVPRTQSLAYEASKLGAAAEAANQMMPGAAIGSLADAAREHRRRKNSKSEGRTESYFSNSVFGRVAWEIDLWGQLRAQRAAAVAEFEATSLEYSFARQSVAATTAQSWYLTITTAQLLDLAEESVRIYDELLRLTRLKKAAGQVGDMEVAMASANSNEARSKLQDARKHDQEAKRNLEVLIGRYPAAQLKATPGFPPVPPRVPAGLPSALLERRPDIVSAEKEVLVAFRATEAAKLALLPQMTLTVEGGRLSNNLFSQLNLNPYLLNVGLGVSIPIFEGGALMAKIKIATAQQQEAVANYGRLVLDAFREAENALTNEDLLSRRLEYYKDALQFRTESVRLATLKYKAGSIDLLSVLQMQTDQLAARAEVIKTQNALLENRVMLHLVLGGSFDATPAVLETTRTGSDG